MQYINCYICTCLALFFISGCIRLPEYQILQFHAFLFVKAAEVRTAFFETYEKIDFVGVHHIVRRECVGTASGRLLLLCRRSECRL